MEPSEIQEFIRNWLLGAERPVKRDSLAAALRVYALNKRGLAWSPATAARRVREAIASLERTCTPIVSTGDGFRVATSPEDLERAARKLERMGVSCLKRAASIRGLSLPRESKQLGLWEAL